MKMKKMNLKLSAGFILIIFLTACNSRTQFRSVAEATQPAAAAVQEPTPQLPIKAPLVELPQAPPAPPVVVTPPPPVVLPPKPPVVVAPPAPVVPQPVQKAGACAPDSSTQLLSCMTCNVPLNPPLPPQLSEKGKALLDIMTIGCSIPNKSAPPGYVPPNRSELLARMNRLSTNLYPDTSQSEMQKKVVSGLKNDPRLQQKIFGGLWYHPPYTDAFETYFGVSIGDVATSICYSPKGYTPSSGIPLQSIEFINCQSNGDSFNCREKPDYVKANTYRDQLLNGMKQSISHPYVSPVQGPAKTCRWESFDGDYDLGGESVVARWLVSNFSVGIEVGNLGEKCEYLTSIPSGANKPRGLVKMLGYVCK